MTDKWEDEGGSVIPGPEEVSFREVVEKLMDRYQREWAVGFKEAEVKALAEGLLEMAATIDTQVSYIGELQQELEDKAQVPNDRLWRPRG